MAKVGAKVGRAKGAGGPRLVGNKGKAAAANPNMAAGQVRGAKAGKGRIMGGGGGGGGKGGRAGRAAGANVTKGGQQGAKTRVKKALPNAYGITQRNAATAAQLTGGRVKGGKKALRNAEFRVG